MPNRTPKEVKDEFLRKLRERRAKQVHASADADATTRESSQLPPASRIAWGILAIVGACGFVWHIAGNPLHELALIRRAQVTIGTLTDHYEDEREHGHRIYPIDVGLYRYHVPDGREFEVVTKVPPGELKEQEEVEYLPAKPHVSRIKGDGCQTVAEWLFNKVCMGGLLVSMACVAAISGLILPGIREIKCLHAARRQSEALPGQQKPISRQTVNPVAEVSWKVIQFLPFVLLPYLLGCLVLWMLTGEPGLSETFNLPLGLGALALLVAVAVGLSTGLWLCLQHLIASVKRLPTRWKRG
jgi:hypothetical protein